MCSLVITPTDLEVAATFQRAYFPRPGRGGAAGARTANGDDGGDEGGGGGGGGDDRSGGEGSSGGGGAHRGDACRGAILELRAYCLLLTTSYCLLPTYCSLKSYLL